MGDRAMKKKRIKKPRPLWLDFFYIEDKEVHCRIGKIGKQKACRTAAAWLLKAADYLEKEKFKNS